MRKVIYVHGRSDLSYKEFELLYSESLLNIKEDSIIVLSGHGDFFTYAKNFLLLHEFDINNIVVITSHSAIVEPHPFKNCHGFSSIYATELAATFVTNEDLAFYLPTRVTGSSLKSVIRRLTFGFDYGVITKNNTKPLEELKALILKINQV